MIRKLAEKDRDACFELVKGKPAENLFIIGDLEAFGFEQDFQEIWGDFTEDGKLRAVLLRYNVNFIPYAEGEFDAQGFADVINRHPESGQLSGIESVTDAVAPYVARSIKQKRTFFYAKCEDDSKLPDEINLSQVRKATMDDIDQLISLQSKIPEFNHFPRNGESLKRSMVKGIARSFYIEEDGQFVSSASTTAENTYAAMVVSVCTLPGYKRKGYATQCLTRLAREVLNEAKTLCLFYDNPEAGKIYKRLGYVDIGKWTVRVLE